ncbi:ATP-binding protein [Fusibacter sp. 3D3]|uniref:ATP-binding protein n=1 Tax=Fusibacter sp. 3D3 TaxID=1048380 RepID=UPI000852C12C|nr:ATP-binding protein [Fusibacter sp. 3D3]GAU79929.1 chemotaxis protein methyltransferase CheR [Fusibacter sp. 3D3]
MGEKLRFRILMTILPVTVILLITSSLYHYNIMKRNMLEYYDETRQNVEAHILDIVNLIDSGYRMLEIRLESDLQEKAQAFLELYTDADGNLDLVDVNQLKLEQGSAYDFMVIDLNTVIIKSTIEEALKFNFTDFDPSLGVKINAIRNGDEIWFEQVRTNVGTGKLSKFAYMPTRDQNYLLEVAYSVDGFDAVTEELRPNSIIKKMTEISPMIVDIKMFDAYGYQIVDSGFNYEPTEESLEIVRRAKLEKNYESIGTDKLRKKYLYIDLNQNRERTMADTDRVIEIIYDEKLLEAQLTELWQTTVLGILIVLIFLILSIFYFSRKLTKPIEALKAVSKQITAGNYDVKVDIDSNDEVGELAKSFNIMVQEINRSFFKIENQKLALEDYNRNLENMVSQRTTELIERNLELESKNHELEIAWIKANEATESKSSFLAMISHEIRTPINGIIGMAYLMLKTKLNVKQSDYTHKIRSLAENLLEIINDVLDVSKLEAGKLSLEHMPFKLEEVFEMLSNQLGYKCAEKGLTLIIKNDVNMPAILIGDSLRVRQVLSNLVNNAIKFTEKGKVIVSASILELKETQIRVQFEIKDTGIGIAPQKIEKLFVPFQQADATITRKYGGTGLGLSICKRFVELMSGEIWVESEINQGSLFYFTALFDLEHNNNENTADPESTRDFNRVGSNVTKRIDTDAEIRILLVEDNLINQQIVRELLEHPLFYVDTAINGITAINAISQYDYDLVLMDIQMPDLDGLEATKRIRALKSKENLPIIAMTAHAMEADRIKCLEVGMNDYMSKPIMETAFFNIIMKWIPKKLEIVEVETELYCERNEISSKLLSFQTKAPIAALHGNWNLYLKLLKDFYNRYQDVEAELISSIDEGEFSEVKGIIHGIRGTSGNLGAMDLFIVSQSLENDLNKGSLDKNSNSLKAFSEEFKRVISDIVNLENTLSEGPDEAHEHISILENNLELDALLEIVKKRLKEGSSETELYIPSLRNAMNHKPWMHLGEILIDQIENYDFYEALRTVDEIESELNGR